MNRRHRQGRLFEDTLSTGGGPLLTILQQFLVCGAPGWPDMPVYVVDRLCKVFGSNVLTINPVYTDLLRPNFKSKYMQLLASARQLKSRKEELELALATTEDLITMHHAVFIPWMKKAFSLVLMIQHCACWAKQDRDSPAQKNLLIFLPKTAGLHLKKPILYL